MSRRVIFTLEDVLGEATDGTAAPEVEHVFYGQINEIGAKTLAELAKQPFCTRILQEQYQVKLDLGKNNDKIRTSLRVRKVNGDSFVLTRKVYVVGDEGCEETSLEIDENLFNFFRDTAGRGLIKMRYSIKPEGYTQALELDVFLDAQGHPTGYAKYDFEVSSEDTPVPPLPVTLFNLRHLNPYRATADDAQLLRAFMESQSVEVSGGVTPPKDDEPEEPIQKQEPDVKQPAAPATPDDDANKE